MKSFSFFIPIFGLLGLAHSLYAADNNAPPATPLQTAVVEQQSIDHTITLDGRIEAVNRGTLSAQTRGQVVAALADVGDLVEKGTVIMRLRDNEQQAEVKKATAAVKAAEAQLKDAEQEYTRISEIHAKKLVAQSALDKAVAAKNAAKANYDAALAQKAQAEQQLSYTRVTAPYTGIVEQRLVEVGEIVSPGTPVFSGMSLDKVRVVVSVPQNDIDAVRHYRQAKVELNDQQSLNIAGEPITFFAYADPITASFKVRVELPEGQEGLYPGMFIKTSFKLGEREALVVPTQAIIHRASMTAVYVVHADRIELRQVRLGAALDKDRQEILSGLAAGEAVALDPMQALALRQKQSSQHKQ